MKTTRRGLFGVLSAAGLAAPAAKHEWYSRPVETDGLAMAYAFVNIHNPAEAAIEVLGPSGIAVKYVPPCGRKTLVTIPVNGLTGAIRFKISSARPFILDQPSFLNGCGGYFNYTLRRNLPRRVEDLLANGRSL